MSLVKVGAYKCSSCDTISQEVDESPLYECGSCGTTFTRDNSSDGSSHRCPNCYKFSSKIADQTCIECGEGEAEEITAILCEVCDTYFDEDTSLHWKDGAFECPNCKKIEERIKEEDRLKALPPDKRGGQTIFKTREEAEIAFVEFLYSVKSDKVSLIRHADYKMGGTYDYTGITWEELPKPLVIFTFEPATDITDIYIDNSYKQPINYSDKFREDVELSAQKYLKGEVRWNNTGNVGNVVLKGKQTDGVDKKS